MAHFEVGRGRLERIEAAVALVKRAMCLAGNEGKLGAAFADDLEKAVRSALAGMEAAGLARQAPQAGH